MKTLEIFEQEWQEEDDDRGVQVIDRPPEVGRVEEIIPKQPKTYMAVLHNDPYTHAHRVVEMLRDIFGQGEEAAILIMLQAHRDGKAPAGGPYSKDVAETKAKQAMDQARAEEFPLMISVEEVETN